MNVRRFAKSVAAAILMVGLVGAGAAAPASAATTGHAFHTNDTGWDRK